MAKIEIENGYFSGNIPYAKFGRGRKNVLFLTGGPGNDMPRRTEVSMTLGALKSAGTDCTMWVTSSRIGQPEKYGTREMAADTAAAVTTLFPDGIHAVMGLSYGGLIAQYLAADFPGMASRYILVATAYRCTPEVAQADRKFAEYLAAGKNGRAFYEVAGYITPPGWKRFLVKGLLLVMGSMLSTEHHPDFKTDVLNEAVAEAEHNSFDVLGTITDPVLMIGGDRDIAFSETLQQETAAGIPGARLILYEGRGHGQVTNHKRFASDVLDFLQ